MESTSSGELNGGLSSPASSMAKSDAPADVLVERPHSKERDVGFLGRLFLVWVFPLVIRGYRQPLEDDDIWELDDRERAGPIAATFKQSLARSAENAAYNNKTRTLARELGNGKDIPMHKTLISALYNDNKKAAMFSGFLKLVDVAFGQIQPVILNLLLRWMSSDRPVWQGYLLGFLLFLAPLIKAIIEGQYFLLSQRTGLRVRGSVQLALYEKALGMSPSARAGSSVGQIVNLMQLDAQRLAETTNFLHVTWAAPLQLLVSLILLFIYIGPSALIGLLMTIVTVPLQGALLKYAAQLRAKNIAITDERVKITNEILQGMKAVKFYAWERPFSEEVDEIRERELKNTRASIWARSGFLVILMALPTVVSVITFAFYAGVFKKPLTVDAVFTGLALLNGLRVPILMFPLVINGLIDARISTRRIEHFLGVEDAETTVNQSAKADKLDDNDTAGQVTITNGTFAWDSISAVLDIKKGKSKRWPIFSKRKRTAAGIASTDVGQDTKEETDEQDAPNTTSGGSSESVVLRNISIEAEPGKLTVIIGRIGSGKSSLIHAMIGEMRKKEGTVALQGSVAYVPQTAWIFNATLRDNILFGLPYDDARYKSAVRVSCLEQDLEALPAGDNTAIGEKGINLSGGQKQRVSIARSVYADAKLYLFDDPLSALDAHVGETVFDKCISKTGVLKRKCRVLVTNQLQFAPRGDKVVCLEDGEITCQGTYKELLATNEDFQKLMMNSNNMGEGLVSEAAESQAVSESKVTESKQHQTSGGTPAADALMSKEERSTGNVPTKVYFDYAKSCGGLILFSAVILASCVQTIVQIMTSWWLSYWTEQTTENGGAPRLGFFLGIYIAFGAGYTILTFFRTVFFLILALQASRKMHRQTFWAVMRAPMSFYDTTPIGRIISRFSRDVSSMDMLVPQSWGQFLNTSTNLIGSYVFIAVITPLFIVAAVPIGLGYYALQRFFNRTNLEVKRLDSNSKSPIYSHFSETLGGLSTIRAFNKSAQFKEENLGRIDTNHRAYFAQLVTNRWFALYLEMLGSLLVLTAALLGVAGRDTLFSGNVALSLTFALQVTSFLGFAVRSITELEAQMNSVERLVYFRDHTPQEPAEFVEDSKPDDSWPANGQIEFKDVQLRYREGLDLVLKGVDVSIPGGCKVGVCGRTGAGKSSLMVVLLRLVDPAAGSILVDGVNLADIGLNEVRSRITIIPQDAVLFSGTLRFNLDPFGKFSDDELWRAVEKANLKDFVSKSNGGLDLLVSEYGENLSAGQRQLLCLARALLRRPKILIMDEATSSVDYETDQIIQKTVRTEFNDCTILTIAHRLWTIADYDRCLVMDDGKVSEYGDPAELLRNPTGDLSLLVSALGDVGAANFRALATTRETRISNLPRTTEETPDL